MKIIGVDNFDRGYIDDQLICENVSAFYADIIVEALNKRFGDNSQWFYKAVNDDHELAVGFR